MKKIKKLKPTTIKVESINKKIEFIFIIIDDVIMLISSKKYKT